MARLDPFSAQIVHLVRTMSDDAILALVRERLGVASDEESASGRDAAARRFLGTARRQASARAALVGKRKPARGAKSARRAPGAPKRVSPERAKVLASVERAVKAAKGLSASQVARATGIGQVRVATALRELKLAKRIYQGGDRRFARYAGDPRIAEAASVEARRTAPGPILKKRPARKR